MDTWGAGYADGDYFDVDYIYCHCSGMLIYQVKRQGVFKNALTLFL